MRFEVAAPGRREFAAAHDAAAKDTKFSYHAWRPMTAIRASDPGSMWTALLPVPMHPEYPRAHCGIGTAASTVMQGLFGSGPFPFSAAALPNVAPRGFGSFREFEEEEAISRIYGGVHYPWSNGVGELVGKQVGEKVLGALRPRAEGAGGDLRRNGPYRADTHAGVTRLGPRNPAESGSFDS